MTVFIHNRFHPLHMSLQPCLADGDIGFKSQVHGSCTRDVVPYRAFSTEVLANWMLLDVKPEKVESNMAFMRMKRVGNSSLFRMDQSRIEIVITYCGISAISWSFPVDFAFCLLKESK